MKKEVRTEATTGLTHQYPSAQIILKAKRIFAILRLKVMNLTSQY